MSEYSTELSERATQGRRRPGQAVLAGFVLISLLAVALVWAQLGESPSEAAAGEGRSDSAWEDSAGAAASLRDVELAATHGTVNDVAASSVVTYDLFLSRDPFEPVVPEEVTSSTDDPGGTDGDPEDPSVPTVPDPDRPPTLVDGEEVYCIGDREVVCNGRVIVLLDTAESVDGARIAVVQVDTTIYEVEEEDVFAGMLVVRSVTETSVTLAFGDETFTLQLGTHVLK